MNMDDIYRQIAQAHGVTEEQVKRDMQDAISEAYENPGDEVTSARQRKVPREGEVPTTEEFLKYCAKQLADMDEISGKE
ncbi:MAG: sporulation initiation factor Spo0A C-terminal domain-containing protein [Clostridia bacterium]|nr:sporulation initiation factor Spo0A C-terminal domain-containing protein [Clostridia bacterium]